MDWAEFAKLIFGRVWFSSFIVLVFSLLAKWVMGMDWGFEMPASVIPWINFALLASASILIVQTGYSVLKGLRYIWSAIRTERSEWSEAKLNMAALYPDEQAVLREFLSDRAPRRFTVFPGSAAQALMDKGILKFIDSAGDAGYLAEIVRPIYDRRETIVPMLPTKQQVETIKAKLRE